ncbi:ycf49-like protein [Populus alba x Populus x berolinensis]|uniref:Ycf49-like protein n=3 Tax=Populus TaxID=3689 RepID=A0A4V6A5G7_POPAL|nr:ycf49-like protein [Populus alba]KAG6791800.1 hypothetical protein POTOM_000933 [Populus tomentosa]KAJ6962578.1 ycf49-like protein [Populus alba x Populus x berolinensis]KAJ7010814.1 ycf49-like protein [Populus alba x Populus x berolinensis]TKR91095.1 hypothetical protein D5086_0000226060 [Populus alba]
MATTTTKTLSLFSPEPVFPRKSKQTIFSSVSPPPAPTLATLQTQPVTQKLARFGFVGLLGAGVALTALEPASATELPLLGQLSEPANALSLPTWAIHVSSVVEWIAAMALVWQYGEKSGFESWKGLAWGMVPLLGGAFCACTWHFFYNSESLEVLVALQAALTVIGNATMCIAAFRIHMSSEERPKNL